MAKFSLYVKENKASDTIYLKLSDDTIREALFKITKIPETCIHKIYDKKHKNYIANRLTSCKGLACGCEVRNSTLKHAQQIMNKKNVELIEDEQGFKKNERHKEHWKKLLNDPHSFLNQTLFEALYQIAETKDDENRKNLRSHARAISLHWENFTKYKVHEVYDDEVQNEWIDAMNEAVITNRKVLPSTIYAYNKAFRHIGNYYITEYESDFKRVGIKEQPTGTKSKLKSKIFAFQSQEQKQKEKEGVEDIRWLTDEEIKILKENICGVRDDFTNNHDFTFEHKNKGYNECHKAFLFSISSGLRYGDCQRLKWEHIDIDNKELKIKPNKNYKKKKARIVHHIYTGDQLDILGEPGQPDEYVFPNIKHFANADWRSMVQKHLHIKPFNYHNARHTFSRHRWNEGKSLNDIAILLADDERTVRKHYHSWDSGTDAKRLKM